MPMVELPCPKEEILAGVDACIATHFHPDHNDMEGGEARLGNICKNTPTFVQSAGDASFFWSHGFTGLTGLYANSSFKGVELIKTPRRHGARAPCGPACAVPFRTPGAKLVISHMESVAHATVTRKQMRDFAQPHGFIDSIAIPADGGVPEF